MVNEVETSDETLYACSIDGCGRRLVINWRRPALTVVDRGDVSARHVGMSGGLQIGVAATQ
jgi:hypothetical protein